MLNLRPLPRVSLGLLVALHMRCVLPLQIFLLIKLSDFPIDREIHTHTHTHTHTHSSSLFADTAKDNLPIYLGGPASAAARGYTHPPSKHH